MSEQDRTFWQGLQSCMWKKIKIRRLYHTDISHAYPKLIGLRMANELKSKEINE